MFMIFHIKLLAKYFPTLFIIHHVNTSFPLAGPDFMLKIVGHTFFITLASCKCTKLLAWWLIHAFNDYYLKSVLHD